MRKPARQPEPEISEERFQAAVQRLLNTPPQPNSGKKPARKRKPASKSRKS